MKITVIYGTQRKSKSSTYNIAQQFIEQLSGADGVSEMPSLFVFETGFGIHA